MDKMSPESQRVAAALSSAAHERAALRRELREEILTDLRPLLAAVLDVAADPPLGHAPATPHCKIYWPRVEKMRDELQAAGLDWRSVWNARHGRGNR